MEKAAVFIDAGHYHYRLYGKWRIDYKKLIKYFENKGYLATDIFYYEGMPSKSSFFYKNPDATYDDLNLAKKKKRGYFRKLRSFSFVVRYKPVRRIYDKEVSQYKLKCNFDVELTMDVMDVLSNKNVDVFILCSGDGDFVKLLRHVKNRGKKIVVVGLKRHTNDELAETAHDVIFLEAIQQEIDYRQ